MFRNIASSARLAARTTMALVALALTSAIATAQTTYTWIGGASAPWTTSTSWSPTRTTPATNDIMVFSSGGSVTATGLITQTIGQLSVTGSTAVTLQPNVTGQTLSIGGGTGTDLTVDSGSALNVSTPTTLTLTLSVLTGATGSISGSMTTSGGTGATIHQLLAADASGITFNSGAVFTQGLLSTGNAFGNSGTANTIVFASGSTFRSQAGSNPFGLGQPSSKVAFQAGSLYKHEQSGTPSFSGRTYPNFEMNISATISGSGSSALSIDNLTTTLGTLNLGMTGTFNLKGNVSVGLGTTLNFNPASASTLTLSGTSAQTITNSGTLTLQTNQNVSLSNAAGLILASDLTVNGTLTLVSGKITTGANTLTIASTGSLAGASSTRYVIGNLKRTFPTAAMVSNGTWDIGDASVYTPVAFNTTTGLTSITMTASTTPGDHLSIGTSGLNAAKTVNRFYTLATAPGTSFGSANLTFNFDPTDLDGGANTSNFVVKKYDSPTWSSTGTGTLTSTSTQATGVTSFSDFQIGESGNHTIVASAGAGGMISPSGSVMVLDGGSQKFTITPDSCYQIDSVLVDGSSVGAPTSYLFTNVIADHTISASFSLKTFTFTNSAGPGGSISPAGVVVVNCGDKLKVDITPDTCYHIASILVDGNPAMVPPSGPLSISFQGTMSNRTVAASFALDTYTISASALSGGMISPSGNVPVNCGSDQKFMITPDACFRIDSIYVDGAAIPTPPKGPFSYAFTNVTANHTINVKFISNPLATTITVASDANPSLCNGKINFTAAIVPGTATGSIDFFDGGVPIGSAPIIAGAATLSITTLSGGYHAITARFGGDACHNGFLSGPMIQQVDCPPGGKATTLVAPCNLQGWFPNNVLGGGSVAPTGTYALAGNGSLEFRTVSSSSKADFVRGNADADLLATLTHVAIQLYRNSTSTSAAHFAPAVRLFVDNGQPTNRFSYLIWEAVYNGVPSVPTDVWNPYDLTKGNFWQRAFKTSPPNKTIDIYNRSIQDWLTPGTVTDGDGDVSNEVGPTARVLAFEIGVGSGWSGTFDGAADLLEIGFSGSDSTFNFEALLPSTVSLASDLNPSTWGAKVNLTATVTPSTATGSVNFFDGGNPIGSGTLSGGMASLSIDSLSVGSHSITATYKGDACYASSTSNKLDQVVNLSPSLTTLAGGPSPSLCGDKVTLTATVSPAAATGSVNFFSGGNPIGSANISAGVAELSITTLAAGNHSITATYKGDACYASSSSNKISQDVNPDSTTVTLAASPNPAKAGDQVTLTATVSPAAASGSVQFFDGGNPIGSGTLTGGVATYAQKFGGGSYSLTASYAGDSCYLGSASNKVTLDVGGPPSISIDDPSVVEGNGAGTTALTFTVTLSTPSTNTVTVDYMTMDSTALVANSDYQAKTGTVTFVPGDVSEPIVINVTKDTRLEGNEVLKVKLSNPVIATIADDLGVGTITNDDVLPTVSIGNVSSNEGNVGPKLFVFTVSLSNQSDQPVSVDYQTLDGATASTAATLANNDYVATSGTITIPAKTSSGTLTVTVNGDSINEVWETFRVVLANPVGATIGVGTGTGTITNDDTSPLIYCDDVQAFEGNAGLTSFVFRVRLSRGVASNAGTVSVKYQTLDGTATVAGLDYVAKSGTLTFGPKDDEGFITISVKGDLNFESDETFSVKLSGPAGGTIGDNTGVGTIKNDDGKRPPVVTVLSPNGGEDYTLNDLIKLSWTAVGPDNPITTIDLCVSYDNGQTYVVIATGLPNTGTFTWAANDSGTNTSVKGPAALDSAYTAFLKVKAHDTAGAIGSDSSNAGWSIYDPFPTPTLLSMFQAGMVPGGIELRWRFSGSVGETRLERGEAQTGPWAAVAAEISNQGDLTVAVDRTITAGRTYWYRLVAQTSSGQQVFGPLSGTAGDIAQFALARISPNPSRGATRIEYTVAREASVRIAVVDVQGRDVAVLAEGVHRAGNYQSTWSGETDRGPAPAGLYFVRYRVAGRSMTQRLVLAR